MTGAFRCCIFRRRMGKKYRGAKNFKDRARTPAAIGCRRSFDAQAYTSKIPDEGGSIAAISCAASSCVSMTFLCIDSETPCCSEAELIATLVAATSVIISIESFLSDLLSGRAASRPGYHIIYFGRNLRKISVWGNFPASAVKAVRCGIRWQDGAHRARWPRGGRKQFPPPWSGLRINGAGRFGKGGFYQA